MHSSCARFFNLSKDVAVTTGYYIAQGSMLKMAWLYPALWLPMRLGCVSLGMAYNEIAAYEALWAAVKMLMGVTVHVGGLAAEHFGKPAGRAVATTVTVYLGVVSPAMGFIAMGLLTRVTCRYMHAAFARGFAWAASPLVASTPSLSAVPSSSPPVGRAEPAIDSDSGTASSSGASVRRTRKRISQAHCVWILGKQENAMQATPCEGKRTKPATLLYDDWFIRNGKRAVNANFPSTADLCTTHRLGYSERKTNTKRTKLGLWNMGVPIPGSGRFEFALRNREKEKSRRYSPPCYKIRKNTGGGYGFPMLGR